MHRATPANTSFRAYSAGGARTTIHSIDDTKQMQEMGGNMMKEETRSKIESPQNYGFTSVVHPPDMDKLGKIIGCAEGFMSFIGGNRSFPVCGIMDDRRHRLNSLAQGDVAMFRGKDDGLQFHLAQAGGFLTGFLNKTLRMQLVQQDQQQSSSGQNGQQQNGQKALYQKDSTNFFDLSKDLTQLVNTAHQFLTQGKQKGIEIAKNDMVYLGAKSSAGKFLKVLLEDGSKALNVFGLKSAGGGGTSMMVSIGDDSDDEKSSLLVRIERLESEIRELRARIGG